MSAERPGTMNRMLEWQPVDWLRYFGLLIWILAAVPLALFPMLTKQPPSTDAMVGWWSGAVLFLLAFLHPCVRLQWRSPLWKRIAVLAVMSVSAFAVGYFTKTGIGSLLAMVVARRFCHGCCQWHSALAG